VAVQASPANVNVSVRIGSPGDNGPVTQVNAAAAVASAPSSTTSRTSAEPATTTTAPNAASAAQAPTPAPQTAVSSSAQDDPDTWTWQWNCLSMPDLSVISNAGSTGVSVPRNWTWIWNCGENPSQYQDADVAQYQPSNTNISIRISSPGNDGPVSQANVAIAAHVGLPAVATPAGSAVVLPLPASVAEVVSQAVIPAMTSLPALVAPLDPAWLGGEVSVRSIVETVDHSLDLPYVLPPLPGSGTFRLVEGQRLIPGLRGRTVPLIGRLAQVGASGLATLSAGADPEGASADGGAATAGASTSHAAKNKKQTRWRAPLPQPTPAQVTSGASFAPATGGSSSGGGIPIFLALPFLAAMLDLARRVTLDRVALPSGHRSRVPEDPG
jgi:hypothetical protein